MNVGGIVLLVHERASDHSDEALAVHEMGCVGCDAYHPALARRWNDIDIVEFKILGSLGNNAHSSAVPDVHILQGEPVASFKRERGVQSGRGAENEGVARGYPDVFLINFVVSVRKSLGLKSRTPHPIVPDIMSDFFFLRVKLQKIAIRVLIAELIPKHDDPALKAYPIVIRELDLDPILARTRYQTFGMECSCVINVKTADRHISGILDIERRDESGEQQCRAVAFYSKAVGSDDVKCYSLVTRVVVADFLKLAIAVVRFDRKSASRQHKGASFAFQTILQGLSYGRLHIVLNHLLRQIILEKDCLAYRLHRA